MSKLVMVLSLLSLACLYGCGGGGDDSEEDTPAPTEVRKPPPEPPVECFTTVPAPANCPGLVKKPQAM